MRGLDGQLCQQLVRDCADVKSGTLSRSRWLMRTFDAGPCPRGSPEVPYMFGGLQHALHSPRPRGPPSRGPARARSPRNGADACARRSGRSTHVPQPVRALISTPNHAAEVPDRAQIDRAGTLRTEPNERRPLREMSLGVPREHDYEDIAGLLLQPPAKLNASFADPPGPPNFNVQRRAPRGLRPQRKF